MSGRVPTFRSTATGSTSTMSGPGGGVLSVDEILEKAREEADDVRQRIEEGRGIAAAITSFTEELADARAKMRQEIQQELDAAEQKLRRDGAAAESRAARLVAEAERRAGEAQRTAAAIVAEAEAKAQAATASERARVEAFLRREDQIQARRQAVQTFAQGAGDEVITLNVRGIKFQVDLQTVLKEPNIDSVIAQKVVKEEPKDGSYFVNGDPTHFHFVLNFLSDGNLPDEASTSELKWLEREAKRYDLHELANLCRRAHNRLDVPRVLELLNGQQKNLSGMDMRALVMTGMDFSGASLHHVNLAGAELRRIAAKGANLRWSDFSNADLEGADLTEADLRGCDLTNANLTWSTLTNTDLRGANLTGATLVHLASVEGAKLGNTKLSERGHDHADLQAEGFGVLQLVNGWYRGEIRFEGVVFGAGVLYQIGTAGGTRKYQNPHVSGDVQVTSSSLYTGKIEHFVAHSSPNSDTYTNSNQNSWFMVDLKEHRRLRVTHYCLRHGFSDGYYRLQNWRLEGSNDGNHWTTLRNHNNDQSLPNSGYSEAGWAVDGCDPGGYRFLRIFQHGSNSHGDHYLMCAGIEFYGEFEL